MIAIDTNVVVRALTDDDPEQAARVRALVGKEDLFLSTTVLLETEWVLRRVYKMNAALALESFVGLPRVRLEHPEQVRHALRLSEQGFDFADALHHAAAAAAGCTGFATFDRDLAKLPASEAPAVVLL